MRASRTRKTASTRTDATSSAIRLPTKTGATDPPSQPAAPAAVASAELDYATIRMRCGKGFYIRALVRDLADALGAEGHVHRLRRTA